MTEYGRGPGSQPWHPEDPLYGDQGWGGQQAVTGQDPYPQDPNDPYGQVPYPRDGYAQDGYAPGVHGQDLYGQDPYGHQQYPHGYPQDAQPFPQQQQQPSWDQQVQQGQQAQQGYDNGGWDGSYGAGMDPNDPYGYAAQGGVQEGFPQQAAHEPPQDAQMPGETQQMPQVPQEAAQEPPEAPQGRPDDHPFFRDDTDGGDSAADDDENAASEGRSKKSKKSKKAEAKSGTKRRSGVACLFVTVVLVGAVGGGGYFAYDFWQTRFGPAPDYAGQGTGQVEVEVPDGSGNAEIGSILAEKGVVKSSGAFVEAVEDSGKFVQPGSYSLRKEMSGAAAVKLMLSPAGNNALIVTEGMRDVAVYAAIDKKTGVKAGTTAGVAKKQAKSLGLPSWANDNAKIKDPLEGFLYPSRYSVGKNAKPADVLRKMVAEAKRNYARYDLEGKAEEEGLDSPLQLLTVASLVQAEGITHSDFRQMAEVVYNRLEVGNTQTNGKLEFDSTYNYIKNQSKLDIPISEIKGYDNPYNTYFYKGLPPGPIGNPGADALKASMNPTDNGWFYFISLDGKTSEFSKTYAEHQKLVDKFNKQRRNG
ncbi:endolytic transglycosylase MltG [Streptomyces sp. Rer75]|uniref:endolytic transglycosylase MltG n=1 Tax=Streptomyces sp. Rer75 TaxID=2750011 RepID=UPI0015CFAC93|nr:endolytic transglycosylase MltG [Streptomyces sp. Rer75]QLH25232.1 endolytic transglycosylase MltG [Streptomyces sp. Rer75]